MSDSASGPATAFGGDRPLYCYITDRRRLERISLIDAMRRAVRWGVDFVQLREKDLSDKALFELAVQTVRLARGTRCRILVNSRPDIALAAGAAGVHLPSYGLRCGDIRSWVPDGFLVGVSVHSAAEAVKVSRERPDYLLLGPIFPTPSKLKYGPPLGLERFSEACRKVSTPILGLGGIHPVQIQNVLEAGAAGIAGISIFQERLLQRRGSRAELDAAVRGR